MSVYIAPGKQIHCFNSQAPILRTVLINRGWRLIKLSDPLLRYADSTIHHIEYYTREPELEMLNRRMKPTLPNHRPHMSITFPLGKQVLMTYNDAFVANPTKLFQLVVHSGREEFMGKL